ncbi:hypothetical protein [Sinanaerobacter sp. ZZT-01]|uniref:hypothetical protein n=1 Tax=Sinanaerobacter sp. ZZT-01 TaxID=3111540 RepID=UPI002D76C23E|nr:hypothetical protein [Sinanaerobacter sp. ZZT-01]WRR92289.1 hypothetical protein U5921_09445 [Sinanaerobacter sp. ZZT-01]
MEQKRIKKRSHILQISYTILATLCVPLNLLYFTFFNSMLSENTMETMSEDTIESAIANLSVAYFILSAIYVSVLIILAILNITQSFQACHERETLFCINGMLILKYGMVIFFIVNFFSIALMLFGISLSGLLISHGTLIIATPVLLPFFFTVISVLGFITWLAMLPGSFFAVQVIRFSYSEKKIGMAAAFCHGLLQFFFLTDVLDTMYLSVKKWGMGKKSSIVIALIYTLGLALPIWTGIKISEILASAPLGY